MYELLLIISNIFVKYADHDMDWTQIITSIVGVVGSIGGITGIVYLYNAKSNKTSIDISNMHAMLEDAKAEREEAQEEYRKFKEEAQKYIATLRGHYAQLSGQFNRLGAKVACLERAINLSYRCKFPENIADCPVLQEYEKTHCDTCGTQSTEVE